MPAGSALGAFSVLCEGGLLSTLVEQARRDYDTIAF